MPYYHGPTMPANIPRMGRAPLTPPEVWGPGNPQQQQYGVIGQSYYDHSLQDQMNTNVVKRSMRYDYDFPPVSAPIYGYRGHDYGYEAQMHKLPPICTYDLDHRLQPIHQITQEVKEEKVAGGVASVLTYKMEQMVDFVSEMATAMHDLSKQIQFKDIDVCLRLVPENATVTPVFRKYVSQVLTSTRLPISTIMLALNYLATRMEIVQDPSYSTVPQANLFSMLTTALMLASKFLDDNTFQNRSWAEVSHTPVAELNKHEVTWLVDMKWHLHFDVDAEFKTWLQCYERYAEAKKVRSMQSSMEALKLSKLSWQPDVARQPQTARYLPQTPLYTPPSHHHESNFGQYRERPNPWQQWNPPRTLSPPSAGPSYPSTPADWFHKPSTGFGQHSMAFSNRPLPPLQILPSNQSPYYAGNYSQYTPVWSGHPPSCLCCHRPSDYHRNSMQQHGYGVSSAA